MPKLRILDVKGGRSEEVTLAGEVWGLRVPNGHVLAEIQDAFGSLEALAELGSSAPTMYYDLAYILGKWSGADRTQPDPEWMAQYPTVADFRAAVDLDDIMDATFETAIFRLFNKGGDQEEAGTKSTPFQPAEVPEVPAGAEQGSAGDVPDVGSPASA